MIEPISQALGVTKSLFLGSAGGAIVSAAIKQEQTIIAKCGYAVCSFIVAIETTPLVHWYFELPDKLDGAVGATLSMFGMLLALRIAETIQKMDFLAPLTTWLKRVFGVKD